MVTGTNTAPDDLAAVQAAVDNASQVILEGSFNFGSGTLFITRDVTLRGRHGAVIYGGGSTTDSLPTIPLWETASAIKIRDLKIVDSEDIAIAAIGVKADIQKIHISSPAFAGILVSDGAGSRVEKNTIENSNAGMLVEFSERVTVTKNTIEAHDVGLFILGVTRSTYSNNSVSIIGNSTGFFDVGRTGVFLVPTDTANANNRFLNTQFEGEMTYGYLVGEGSAYNTFRIAPRNLDHAIFIPPPFFGLCENGPADPNPSGATVLLIGETDFGPASVGNTVYNQSREASFLDCGVGNLVR